MKWFKKETKSPLKIKTVMEVKANRIRLQDLELYK